MLANVTGQAVLDRAVTAATFLGPPVVVVGDGLTLSDTRWTALAALASEVAAVLGSSPAPLVGLAPGDDPGPLDAALAALSCFFDVSAVRPYCWSAGRADLSPASLCGPVFSAPSVLGQATSCAQAAWALSGRYLRATYGNLYGVGLFAIGPGDPEAAHGPPVYPLAPPPAAAGAVKTIGEVWRRGGPSTLASYQALIDAEATRFGISRRTHPALVPYLLLAAP